MLKKKYKTLLLVFLLGWIWLTGCAPASHVRLGLDIHVPTNYPDFTGTDSLVIGRPAP